MLYCWCGSLTVCDPFCNYQWQVHGEMLYQLDPQASETQYRTPRRRPPGALGSAVGGQATARQRLAGFKQWLRLLLFQLLTLAVEVGCRPHALEFLTSCTPDACVLEGRLASVK